MINVLCRLWFSVLLFGLGPYFPRVFLVQFQDDPTTTLGVNMNALAHWTQATQWSISNSFEKTDMSMWNGWYEDIAYNVVVTKGLTISDAYVDGTVNVTNLGNSPTQGLSITVELRR